MSKMDDFVSQLCCFDIFELLTMMHQNKIKIMNSGLDKEKYQFNLSGYHLNHAQKIAMQSHYKQQLDHQLREKNKKRQTQFQTQINEKNKYNQLTAYNRQSQKMKEQAYKNYYNMVLNNQEQFQKKYISPFQDRDSLKDQHIDYIVREGQRRSRQKQAEDLKRSQQRRRTYKTELQHQLQERSRLNSRQKQILMREKQRFQKHTKEPNQLRQHQRIQQIQHMKKYRHDLDQVRDQQTKIRNSRLEEDKQLKLSLGQHHPLINPVPYTIQNPYIRKQIQKESYFSAIGNKNI